MVGLDGIVRVLLEHVPSRRGDIVDDAWVDRCPVGRDLNRRWPIGKGSGEERSRRSGITTLRDENVDDVAVLVDCSV